MTISINPTVFWWGLFNRVFNGMNKNHYSVLIRIIAEKSDKKSTGFEHRSSCNSTSDAASLPSDAAPLPEAQHVKRIPAASKRKPCVPVMNAASHLARIHEMNPGSAC